ncbi:MAG: hypothetical protein WCX12_03370 [Candidatus Paceibacterota bacterium]
MGKFWKFFPLVLTGIFFLVFLIVPQVAHGEVSLWPAGFWATDGLVPPQCQEQSCQSLCDLMDLGQRVVYFALTILLFIIVPIMVMWGGLTILTSGGASTILEGGKKGSPAGISRGKKILTGAIIGAALGVGSFLIINTFIWGLGLFAGQGQGKIGWGTVVCTPPPMGSGGLGGAGTGNNGTGNNGTGNNGTGNNATGTGQLPGGTGNDDATIRAILTAAGIKIHSSGNCNDISNPSCTSLLGLPWSAVDGLKAIKNACPSCDLIVTGGTEVGHNTHGPGKARVDIDNTPSVNNYVYSQIGLSTPVPNTWYTGNDGVNYYWEVDHWHLCWGHLYNCQTGG